MTKEGSHTEGTEITELGRDAVIGLTQHLLMLEQRIVIEIWDALAVRCPFHFCGFDFSRTFSFRHRAEQIADTRLPSDTVTPSTTPWLNLADALSFAPAMASELAQQHARVLGLTGR